MKQELPTSDHTKGDTKTSPAAARYRAPRAKDGARAAETANVPSPGSKLRPKPAPSEPDTTHNRARRPIILNRLKPGGGEDVAVAPRKESTSQLGGRSVEQYARLRRRPDANGRAAEKVTATAEELQRRVEASEQLAKELQCEVSALKAQSEKLQGLNVELGAQNKQLVEKLSAAEAQIAALERRRQAESINKETNSTEYSNVKKLIANKLDYFKAKKEIVRENGNSNANVRAPQSLALDSGPAAVQTQPKAFMAKPLPPPPPTPAPTTGAPPPPPPPPPAPVRAVKSASALIEMYHSLKKRDGVNPSVSGNRANKAHNSIVGELQNRSAHLIAIKADVETKGEFIKYLIEKVHNAAYMDMEDVLTFVDCLDQELSTLADERAVLKHFNWPERKADALREATVEYRDLKRLEHEGSSFEDDLSMPCEASLKKIESLLDKLERSIQRLIKLRGTSMLSYGEYKIPVDWMMDSGMVRKIKLASAKLAKVYMNRLSTELELLRHSERESLIFQGVRFAYRAHQFAGGLDPETMRTFEELRERVQAHGKGPKELIPSIRVS